MTYQSARLLATHTTSRILHTYADWRIGATTAEKRCYKASNTILLTFDDYGTKDEVEEVLAILGQNKIKAMFFLQGSWAQEQPALVAAIAQQGHVIGNHTYSHTTLLNLSDQAVVDEISRDVKSKWLRPPQGRYNKRVRNVALSLGYRICYWTIDSRDWTGASVAAMRHTILSELHPGAVILFHLHGVHTRQLLKEILPEIKDRGFSFTTHNESW